MKFSILILLLISAVLLFLSATSYQLPTVSAQTVTCLTQSPNPRVSGGLITTPVITNRFGNDIGKCVVDPKAAFAPYNIPTYDDLKSIYYDQSKAAKTDATPGGGGTANQGTIRSALNNYDVILIQKDVNITGSLSGTPKTAVVFIDGDLNFNNNLTFGDANSGLVFIVRDNVNIDTSVTQIDAVIISSGTIRTAGSSCSHTSPVTASQLVINGSLVSLADNNIEFCRTLTSNSSPAEIINHQSKYLVILRNLFADTTQKWSEIQ